MPTTLSVVSLHTGYSECRELKISLSQSSVVPSAQRTLICVRWVAKSSARRSSNSKRFWINSFSSQAVKEPYFVPDSIKADVLFKRMRDERIRIAVVLDEYGGVTGIVTLSDILELLVGDLNGCDETAEGDAN